MAKKQGIGLAVIAFTTFIAGGFGCFGGIGLILLMQDRNVLGWGNGRSIGYLLICVGLCLSILGVLLMRIFRNRGLA